MNIQSATLLVRAGYSMLVRTASLFQSPFLLVIRLYWGWEFFVSGKAKLTNHDQIAEFFDTLNIPMPGLNAWMAGTVECVGGLFLLAGLASRLTAIPLIVTMIVAYLTAESETVKNIFEDPDKFTGATPFLFLLVLIIVFVFGPGAFSLDRLIAWKFGVKPEPATLPGDKVAADLR